MAYNYFKMNKIRQRTMSSGDNGSIKNNCLFPIKQKYASFQNIKKPDSANIQLQNTIGNQAVQRLLQKTTIAQQKDIGTIEPETPTKTPPPVSKPAVTARPKGIEKTSVVEQKLHFGARYKHTLKSTDGKLEGIHITEKVTKVKDDFNSGLGGVETGKNIARIDENNEFTDRIWTSFGSFLPAIESLRGRKKPAESLLGSMEDHQELYYWENRKPVGWKKFTDVKIVQHLYDLPGLVVVTFDNGYMADLEHFTTLPSRKEEERQLENTCMNRSNYVDPNNQLAFRELETTSAVKQSLHTQQTSVKRQLGEEETEATREVSSYVFIDAPISVDPTKSRIKPLVSSKKRAPLPPVGSDYSWRFWHPNLQYRSKKNGEHSWWEDHLKEDGSWYRSFWQFNPIAGDWHVGGYPLTSPPDVKPKSAEEKQYQIEDNPEKINLGLDLEVLFGPRIATQEHVNILGWEGRYLDLYLDRTMILYPDDGSPPIYFLHHPGGSTNAFEFYNQQGEKTIIIVPIEIEKIFGPNK